jgi:hypothetical protein
MVSRTQTILKTVQRCEYYTGQVRYIDDNTRKSVISACRTRKMPSTTALEGGFVSNLNLIIHATAVSYTVRTSYGAILS